MKGAKIVLAVLALILVFSENIENYPQAALNPDGIPEKMVIPDAASPKSFKSPYGRVLIRFSKNTPKETRKKFFTLLGAELMEFDVFGYDIGRWQKSVKKAMDVKLLYEKFKTANPPSVAEQLIDYELEIPLVAKSKSRKQSSCGLKNEIKNVASQRRFIHWFDKLLGITTAHNFLQEKKVPLEPIGIVIVDEAPEFSHPDIKPVLKYKMRKPIYWISDGRDIKDFYSEHGTHVACLAAAHHDGKGIEGIAAPNAYVLPLAVRYKDNNMKFSSDIALGLKYFKELEDRGEINFRVVNMSFYIGYDSKIVYAAMESLSDKLFVLAATNTEDDEIVRDIDVEKRYPASWLLFNKLTVTAINEDSLLAPFSNYGMNSVDIAAPGISVMSCTLKGKYVERQGTSMSAPLVAGAAALLFAMEPGLTVSQAISIINFSGVASARLKNKVKGGLFLDINSAVKLLYNIKYVFDK